MTSPLLPSIKATYEQNSKLIEEIRSSEDKYITTGFKYDVRVGLTFSVEEKPVVVLGTPLLSTY
jgi:hypothetical protein